MPNAPFSEKKCYSEVVYLHNIIEIMEKQIKEAVGASTQDTREYSQNFRVFFLRKVNIAK